MIKKILKCNYFFASLIYLLRNIFLNIKYILLPYDKKFSYKKLIKSKSCDNKDFIVLGSGSSISDLNDIHFGYFKKNITIGLGRWVFHDFVPDIYLLETSDDPKLFQWTKDFIELINQKADSYSETFIIFDGASSSNIKRYIKRHLNSKLYKNVFYSHTIKPPSGHVKYFTSTLYLFRLLKFFSYFNLTLHCRSSTVLSALLGYFLGANKIVLAGIDGYTGYFIPFNNHNFHKDFGGLEKNKSHTLHSTSNPAFGLPTLPDCIYEIDKNFIPMKLVSNKSVLFPTIELIKL